MNTKKLTMGTFHRQLLRYVCDWSRTYQRPEEALISASVRYFPAAMTSGA